MTMLMAKGLLAVHRWVMFHLYALKMRLVLGPYSRGWAWANKQMDSGKDPRDLFENITFRLVCHDKPAEFIRGAKSACKNRLSL